MEISKEYAEKLVKDALELLYQAHHKYYKDTDLAEEDDLIVDAIEILQEFEEKIER